MSDLQIRHPRPESERPAIAWDTPVGSAHAHNIVEILRRHESRKELGVARNVC